MDSRKFEDEIFPRTDLEKRLSIAMGLNPSFAIRLPPATFIRAWKDRAILYLRQDCLPESETPETFSEKLTADLAFAELGGPSFAARYSPQCIGGPTQGPIQYKSRKLALPYADECELPWAWIDIRIREAIFLSLSADKSTFPESVARVEKAPLNIELMAARKKQYTEATEADIYDITFQMNARFNVPLALGLTVLPHDIIHSVAAPDRKI
ncbi:MAG: hypothetical protein DDT34_02215 [Firmicutes bacterium]|nr:hypothetical protein [Bacillota bacterium]MBT9165374.1 hypothetical protein [Chloroflexota bacterium]